MSSYWVWGCLGLYFSLCHQIPPPARLCLERLELAEQGRVSACVGCDKVRMSERGDGGGVDTAAAWFVHPLGDATPCRGSGQGTDGLWLHASHLQCPGHVLWPGQGLPLLPTYLLLWQGILCTSGEDQHWGRAKSFAWAARALPGTVSCHSDIPSTSHKRLGWMRPTQDGKEWKKDALLRCEILGLLVTEFLAASLA